MGGKKSAIKSIARFSAPGWRAGAIALFIELCTFIARPRRQVALANIDIAYPGCSLDFKEGVLRGVYHHLAWTAAETLALQKDPAQSLEWVAATEGEDLLAKAAEAGKGAVILTGHLGNWELLAAWLCQRGYPLTAIVRDPDDADYRDTISEFRTRVGLKTLPKQANMKAAIDLLRPSFFAGAIRVSRFPLSHVDHSAVSVPKALDSKSGFSSKFGKSPRFARAHASASCPSVPV